MCKTPEVLVELCAVSLLPARGSTRCDDLPFPLDETRRAAGVLDAGGPSNRCGLKQRAR
jgi:hypothetical protein